MCPLVYLPCIPLMRSGWARTHPAYDIGATDTLTLLKCLGVNLCVHVGLRHSVQHADLIISNKPRGLRIHLLSTRYTVVFLSVSGFNLGDCDYWQSYVDGDCHTICDAARIHLQSVTSPHGERVGLSQPSDCITKLSNLHQSYVDIDWCTLVPSESSNSCKVLTSSWKTSTFLFVFHSCHHWRNFDVI